MSPVRRSFVRRSGSGLVALAAVMSPMAAAPPAASAAGPGVCQGVVGCRVVAHVDVNGDGTKDAVGVARRGTNGKPGSAVIVRVRTGARSVVAVRRPLDYWFGSPWHGAAALDGRKGAELVVGHVTGAHTQFLWVLTWRRGRLVTLPAPDSAPDWVIDGAANVALGWQRRPTDPVGTVRRLEAHRNGSGTTFTGTVSTYRWSAGAWRLLERRTSATVPQRSAFQWGGFHVPGLPRY
jgi:hypothetical protein